MKHIIDVLTGEQTDSIQSRQHDQISTFGIGKGLSREQWQTIGRELTRIGLLEVAAGKYATVELTAAGLAALKRRETIWLTKIEPARPRAGKSRRKKNGSGVSRLQPQSVCETEFDDGLFKRLRKLRRKIADERNVPAYIIFSDATLREMARQLPRTREQFSEISGVGEEKLQLFAEMFVAEIRAFGSQELSW